MSVDATTRETATFGCRSTKTDPFLTLGPSPGAPLDLPSGTQLDRFCVRKKLGQGSLGEVYQADDTVNEREVAIKVVTVASPESAMLASLLKHEKAMYDRVQGNQHVLKVNDVFPARYEGRELLVLSMELADGGTLRDWLDQYRRDGSTRRRLGGAYIYQMCHAVAALHEVGIVHLDLKPSNYLFVGGILKIADLGVAALLGTDALSLASKWRVSDSCVKVGTLCYSSPEHVTARPDVLDERSDIYSLGLLIYEILSPKGRPPFEGDEDLLRKLHTSVPAPALEDVTEAEARVVRRCLEKDPARRYQTVRALLDDLEGRADPSEGKDDEARAAALWSDACASLEQGWLSCARTSCGLLLKLAPDHEDAGAMVQQLDERFEQAGQIYGTIGSKMDALGLEELIQLAIAGAQLYPGHPAAFVVLVRLEAKATRYGTAMEEGLRALGRSDWQMAQDWFERARSNDPGSAAAERAVRFATGILEQLQETHHLMDVAVENSDFAGARRLADELDGYVQARREEAIAFLAEFERGGRPILTQLRELRGLPPVGRQTSRVVERGHRGSVARGHGPSRAIHDR